MNRKLLVGFLILLAVGNIGTLLAMGLLSQDAGTSSSANTTTLNAAAGLTPVVSTTVTPRIHQHYKVGLSISLGDCVNPYGISC